MAEDPLRAEAHDALLRVLHELHPRIPNLNVGDCHCNLLAEVALDALDIPGRHERAYRAGQEDAARNIRRAVERLFARLIATAHLLDVPFTNAPEQSPWTKVKGDMQGVMLAIGDALGIAAGADTDRLGDMRAGREDAAKASGGDERVTLARSDLQHLFDLAVNSMDFGSGFWDGDDVPPARRVAEALGVDPMLATPRNERWKYPHPWRGSRYEAHGEGHRRNCADCNKPADFSAHGDEAEHQPRKPDLL